MGDAPPPNAPPQGTPAHRRGAARADAVPRIETVRVTQPDLLRRGALEKTRNRLVYTAFGFGLLFLQGLSELAKRIAALRGAMKIDTHYEAPLQ